MPIPWLAVLKMVPWGDVVSNAPKIADGAKKLWNSVASKSPPNPEPTQGSVAASAPLESRVAALQMTVADLQNQMVASSELINSLAEQNAQLINRMAILRRRMFWLAAILCVLAAGLLLNVALAPAG